jgi:hypothetical protein
MAAVAAWPSRSSNSSSGERTGLVPHGMRLPGFIKCLTFTSSSKTRQNQQMLLTRYTVRLCASFRYFSQALGLLSLDFSVVPTFLITTKMNHSEDWAMQPWIHGLPFPGDCYFPTLNSTKCKNTLDAFSHYSYMASGYELVHVHFQGSSKLPSLTVDV